MKMKLFKKTLVAGLAALLFSGCSVTSHSETARSADFSRYRSFGWKPEGPKKADRANNDIIDNNIKNAVSSELEKKGWRETDDNPDVLLDYTIAVEKGNRRESDPVYSYPYTQYIYGRRGRVYSLWHPSMLMGYHTYNVPFRNGQLTVNIIDAASNKLVWQGWAEGEIKSNHLTSKDIGNQVKSIFRKFDHVVKR